MILKTLSEHAEELGEIELAEEMYQNKLDSLLIQDAKDAQYRHFALEAQRRNIALYPLEEQWLTKTSMLTHYFPGQFGLHGKQPIYNHDEREIGIVFRKIYEFGHKKIQEMKREKQKRAEKFLKD